MTVDLGEFGRRAEVARRNQQAKTHFDLAQTHHQAQRWAEAVADLAPNRPEFWNTLGVAFYRNGEWQQAIDSMTKAEQLKPDTYFGHNAFFLAMAHWQLGEKETARTLHNRAIEWVLQKPPSGESADELRRFRAETDQLLVP